MDKWKLVINKNMGKDWIKLGLVEMNINIIMYRYIYNYW
jgi:hypothetical protein